VALDELAVVGGGQALEDLLQVRVDVVPIEADRALELRVVDAFGGRRAGFSGHAAPLRCVLAVPGNRSTERPEAVRTGLRRNCSFCPFSCVDRGRIADP
jgi:hypothetical protein